MSALTAVVAIVGTDGPMTLLGIADLRTWAAKDWLTDLVHQLAYGLVTAAVTQNLGTGK